MTFYSDPPRNINDFQLTTHAKQQVRDRKISIETVKNAIRKGVEDEEFANESHQTSFILEFPGPDLILIIDSTNNNIVSVYYDDRQGAEGGSLVKRPIRSRLNGGFLR